MRLFLFAVYLAVTLVCVGISGVALYEGAFPLLGWPAIPIAVAVALVLLAFDIVLRAQIRSGGRWLRVVGALIVVAALSWTFLFTTFYSAAMRDDVVAARLEEASARFDQNIATARGAVQSAAAREGLQERHRRARELFEEMQRQALDRQNCGVGRETREYRDAIDKLLEVPITNLKPPAGCQAGEIRAWIEDVRGAMEGRIAREVEKDSFVIATKFLDGALAKKNELVSSGAGASYIRQRAIIEALIDLTRQVEVWAAPGFTDTEFRCLVGSETGYGTAKSVYTRVQA